MPFAMVHLTHYCNPGGLKSYPYGTVVRCTECKQLWKRTWPPILNNGWGLVKEEEEKEEDEKGEEQGEMRVWGEDK